MQSISRRSRRCACAPTASTSFLGFCGHHFDFLVGKFNFIQSPPCLTCLQTFLSHLRFPAYVCACPTCSFGLRVSVAHLCAVFCAPVALHAISHLWQVSPALLTLLQVFSSHSHHRALAHTRPAHLRGSQVRGRWLFTCHLGLLGKSGTSDAFADILEFLATLCAYIRDPSGTHTRSPCSCLGHY